MRAPWALACLALLAVPLAAQDAPAALTPAPTAALAAAVDAYRGGDYDGAEAALRGALPDPPARLWLARLLRETGRYGEAEALLTGGPLESGALHLELGEVLLATGRDGEARAAFERAWAASGPLRARLAVAEIDLESGSRERAFIAFSALLEPYRAGRVRSSRDLAAVAAALVHLGRDDPARFRDALRVYDAAIAADPDDLDARVELGDLFLAKHNGADALETYEGVLESNPRHPGALLGLARVRRFDGATDVFELTARCLAVNPNLVPALVLQARQYLDLEDFPAADRQAERALEVDPRSVEALTLLAASALLAGDEAEHERRLARAREVAPRDPEVFNTLAELAARSRLYHRAAELAGRGIELDPAAWRSWSLRGANRLRIGEIEAGRRDLEKAFAGDPFDARTKNTLDLFDTVATFRTVATERFELVLPAEEAELMALYMGPLAEEAYDRLAGHYGVELELPVRIEVYARHADFSVRTIGVVGLGALGVSFGPVIAVDAPSARPPGELHWGTTLWHELAHSFHMRASGSRVPRWFTEGLAVFEERRARQGWGDRAAPEFLIAYKEGRLAPVEDLNQGFMRPEYPQQIGFSYYQASLVFDYLAERWGFERIVDLLAGYRDGLSTPELFRAVLDVSLESFAADFDAYFQARFAGPLAALRVVAGDDADGGAPRPAAGLVVLRPAPEELRRRADDDPGDFIAQLAAGRALVETDPEAARPYLERAKALFPDYAGADSPYWLLGRAHRRAERPDAAVAELEELVRRNQAHYPALRALAELRAERGDAEGAARALDSAQYLHPYDDDDHRQLAAWWLEAGRPDAAVRERRAVLALAPFNRPDALYHLAAAQLAAGDRRGARSTVLEALEQAPNHDLALELLLELSGASP